jgi:hypothetical protein
MCAIFSFNAYMLRLWADYWSAIGVGTFYLYYNGAAGDVAALNATLAGVRASVVWVVWPALHWIDTDSGDITHGQPMAVADCLARFRDDADFFLFYDLDEFLVLPRHDGLTSFVDSYAAASAARGPIVALRTPSAWAMLDLEPGGATVADLNVTAFATVAVHRARVPGGREKYLLNASAREVGGCADGADDGVGCPDAWPRAGALVHNANLHGVYRSQARASRAHVELLQADADRFPAYHLHLLNTRAPERVADGRHLFFPKDNVRD